MPDIPEPTFFESQSEFRHWLEKHHDTAQELWVGYRKKGTGLREWQRSRVYKVTHMGHSVWELTFKKLTTIPSKDKELDGTPESMNTTRKTARSAD